MSVRKLMDQTIFVQFKLHAFNYLTNVTEMGEVVC